MAKEQEEIGTGADQILEACDAGDCRGQSLKLHNDTHVMYRPAVAQRIALLHPAILTIVWILLHLVSLAALGMPLFQGIFTALLAGLMCGWSWAIFTVSLARRPAPEIPEWTPWIFLAPPAIMLVAAIFGLPSRNSPVPLLFFATLFFALWRAAEALEREPKLARLQPLAGSWGP